MEQFPMMGNYVKRDKKVGLNGSKQIDIAWTCIKGSTHDLGDKQDFNVSRERLITNSRRSTFA